MAERQDKCMGRDEGGTHRDSYDFVQYFQFSYSQYNLLHLKDNFIQ